MNWKQTIDCRFDEFDYSSFRLSFALRQHRCCYWKIWIFPSFVFFRKWRMWQISLKKFYRRSINVKRLSGPCFWLMSVVQCSSAAWFFASVFDLIQIKKEKKRRERSDLLNISFRSNKMNDTIIIPPTGKHTATVSQNVFR